MNIEQSLVAMSFLNKNKVINYQVLSRGIDKRLIRSKPILVIAVAIQQYLFGSSIVKWQRNGRITCMLKPVKHAYQCIKTGLIGVVIV